MQLIITDSWLARRQPVHFSGRSLVTVTLAFALVVMLLAAGLYRWVVVQGAREGWPVVGSFLRLVVKDEFEQRDRFLRENLDLLARRLGEMQVRMMQLDALGDRVGSLAGIPSSEIKPAGAGSGGPLQQPRPLDLAEVQAQLQALEQHAQVRGDTLTSLETRLFEQKVKSMMVPTQMPVPDAVLGSPFGWRIDPFTGLSAQHTGQDMQAESGAPILAAAGGVVVTQEFHPDYGNMVEIDHGNGLVTRYAHASRVLVKRGDLVRRGQKIAAVGASGRATGTHLHFEVLVNGVAQDPLKFLEAGRHLAQARLPGATGRR